MIAVVDYGLGNLRSVQKAFEYIGLDAKVTDSRQDMRDASHVVLPGVGAIADAMERLEMTGLAAEVATQAESGKPFLGICLGMQLMLDVSYENGEHPCLGLIHGEIKPFDVKQDGLKVPHMGWNSLSGLKSGLFDGLPDSPYVYFVHSYHAANVGQENVAAVCGYGYDFVCGIYKDNIYGLQFHPEKSGDDGLKILKNFGGMK